MHVHADVELGNRKGKLITIYDCSFALAWSGKSPHSCLSIQLRQRQDILTQHCLIKTGKASDGSEVKGKITFPEVSHEIEDNEEEYRVSPLSLSPSSPSFLTPLFRSSKLSSNQAQVQPPQPSTPLSVRNSLPRFYPCSRRFAIR